MFVISPVLAQLAKVIDGRVLEFALPKHGGDKIFSSRAVSWQNVLMWSREKAALQSPNCDRQLKIVPFSEFLIRLIRKMTSRVARQHPARLICKLLSSQSEKRRIHNFLHWETRFRSDKLFRCTEVLCFRSRALMANLGSVSRGGHSAALLYSVVMFTKVPMRLRLER